MPKIYEGESKSKVNLPVEALQSKCETSRLSRHCRDWSVSCLFSVVFVYKSCLKTTAVSKCAVVEQRAVINFLWSEGFKTSEAGDMQQAQRFAVRGGSFAPQ